MGRAALKKKKKREMSLQQRYGWALQCQEELQGREWPLDLLAKEEERYSFTNKGSSEDICDQL